MNSSKRICGISKWPPRLFPRRTLGVPIDTDAGDAPIKKLAHPLRLSLYEDMVSLGQVCLLGKTTMH